MTEFVIIILCILFAVWNFVDFKDTTEVGFLVNGLMFLTVVGWRCVVAKWGGVGEFISWARFVVGG